MSPSTSRTLLVTLVGALVRQTGDWMSIKGIVALMEELGIDDSSTRTAVSRLKKRGWLAPEKLGGKSGYRLTALAQQSFASGDAVIWHARQPARLEDGWCIATFSVPEQQRAKRHLLRSRLAALGFGNVGQGMWIAPARMAADALELIDRLGLTEYTNILVGRHAGGQDLARMVRESWDLDAIEAGYRDYISRHQLGFQALLRQYEGKVPARESYIHYLRALDDWRVLPMRDPGLPRELLRSDWPGDPATQLIEEIVMQLEEAALVFVREKLAS